MKRRTLAKGALWSVPVIVAAGAAPVMAASPQPELHAAGRGTWNSTWYPEQADGHQTFKLFSTAQNSSAPGQGFCIANSKSTTSISNASVTYYVPYSTLTFTARSGTASNGWSVLTRDTSKASKSYNGNTYYAYTSVYSGGITAQNGTTCYPSYAFESNGGLNTTGYFYVDHSVIVNGTTQHKDFGPVRMNG